jgi:hypothetical protein
MTDMGDIWVVKCGENASLGVPAATVTDLGVKVQALKTLNAVPLSERTAVVAAQLKTAEKALKEAMRDIKRRYFFVPPLTDADIVALGLRPKDTVLTPVGAPTMPAEGNMTFPAKGLVDVVKIRPGGQTPDKRASYGVRIYYGVLGADDGSPCRITKAPKTGDGLPYSVFTRKQNHRFDFTAERGNKLFVCLRYENSKGQSGSWGEVMDAFVP